MTAKRTELEKNKGSKILGEMRRGAAPDRFGAGAAAVVDRREQRRRDQAAGLVPFATKLPGELVKALGALAAERGVPLNDLVTDLLRKGIAER